MRLHYTLIDPTKNITLLVTTPVQRQLQPQTAAWLLRHEPQAEQVGFLEPSDTAPARLQMMGGEFCGNATMGLGAWLCRRDRLAHGVTHDFSLEISGAEEPVPCAVTPVAHGYLATVELPLPQPRSHTAVSVGLTYTSGSMVVRSSSSRIRPTASPGSVSLQRRSSSSACRCSMASWGAMM